MVHANPERINSGLLYRRITTLARPNSDNILNMRDEYLPITNLTGLCFFQYGGDSLFGYCIRHYNFNFHLRNKGNIISAPR